MVAFIVLWVILMLVWLVVWIAAFVAINKRDREIKRLNNLVSEHHAVGLLRNRHIGDPCPVCSAFLPDRLRPSSHDHRVKR